jgi:sec-independent protein translocase protein TatB
MFDIGTQELIIIFIVALLVFGPKKLPELARTLGKGVRELKSAMQGIKDNIDDVEKDIKKDIDITKDLNITKDIKKKIKENVFPGDLFDLQEKPEEKKENLQEKSGEKKDKVSSSGQDKEGDVGGEQQEKAGTGNDG